VIDGLGKFRNTRAAFKGDGMLIITGIEVAILLQFVVISLMY